MENKNLSLNKKLSLINFFHLKAPVIIWLELFAAFVNAGTNASTLFIALYSTTILHFNSIEVGWVISALGIGSIIGSLFSGYLSDLIPAHFISLTMLAINGLTLLLFPYLHNFYLILLITTSIGISNYAFSPANRFTIMRMSSHSNQSKINSVRYMLANLGIGFYMFLDGRLSTWSYSSIFFANGIIVLLTAITLLIVYHEHPTIKTQLKSKNDLPLAQFPPEIPPNFFIRIYFGLILVTFIFSQIRSAYPLYLNKFYHLDLSLISNIFILNTFIIVFFQILILNIAQQFNSLLTSGIGALLIGLGMGLLFLSSNYFFAILLCFMWTIGEILFFSTMQTIIYQKAKNNSKGKHLGMYQSTNGLGNVIGPIVGAWLYTLYNGTLLWYSCIGFSILAFFLIYFRMSPTYTK